MWWPLFAGTPNLPQITQLEAYQANSNIYIVNVSWVAEEVNYDLDYHEVEVIGVDSTMIRVQDTRSTIVIEGVPPVNVTVQVTTVSQCGQRSNLASETASVAATSVPSGKESHSVFSHTPCNNAVLG